MSRPGYVVHPNGRKLFVEDKLAYFDQHPEAVASTLKIQREHTAERERIAAELDKEEAGWKEFRRQKKVALEGEGLYHHWCIGGKVPRGCESCKDSFFLPLGLGVPQMPCQKCRAKKLSWSDCETCSREGEVAKMDLDVDEVAGAEAAEVGTS